MRAPLLVLAAALAVFGCGGEPTSRPLPEPDRAALDRAVERGLTWLADCQEEDGSFSLQRWNPHHGRPRLEGFSEEDRFFDMAATGLVVLAFAEAGHSSVTLEGDSCCARALRWLLTRQIEEGRFGYYEDPVDRHFVIKLRKRSYSHPRGPGYKARTIHMFNHAVATAAVAVAYRACKADALRVPLRRALRHLVQDEHPEYIWTSYYDPFSDVAVVPYVVLAARAAADAGLEREAEPLLEPIPDFLGRVTDEKTGRTAMLADHPRCFDGHDSTAISAFCRRLIGEDPSAAPLSLALASITGAPLDWKPAPADLEVEHIDEELGAVVNHELWHYGARALRGLPDAAAVRFRKRVHGLLVANQRAGGPLAGSWDPIGVWDRVGGRLYATAMAVRTLAAAR